MKSLDKLLGILLGGLLFLLPVFFLPITGDFFDFNKLVLLVLAVLVGLAVWSLSFLQGEFKVRLTPLDLPLFLFALAVLLSSLLVTPNKLNAFVFPGEATAIIAATFLYFLVVQYTKDEDKRIRGMSLLSWLLAGGAVAGLVSLVSSLGGWGLIGRFITIPAWINQPTFSTLGLPLPTIMLFVVLLPLAAGGLVKRRTENAKRPSYSILYTLYTILILAGLVATVYRAFPGGLAFPRNLPYDTGWSIALETLKRAPLLGVGPGNFFEAFNRFRPVEYNLTDVWNLRFASSSDWYLHVFTTTGLLGIAALGLLLWVIYRMLKDVKGTDKGMAKGEYLPAQAGTIQYTLYTILLLFLLLPATLVTLVVFYVVLGMLASRGAREVRLELAASEGTRRNNLLPGALSLLFIIGLGLVLYFGSRIYTAEMSFREALNAVANDGAKAYNKLIETINRSPRVDRYRVIYSQINLALANNIAAKKDLTEQERNTVSQLIQQAIREGKAAVALNQNRAENWESLARIYQSLIPAAQGSDQFAIATYQQAIALDPVNPQLRVALGGVFYGLARYDDAIRVFELAVAAKPNHPNAHFNLASALREKKDTQRAVAEMEQVLGLVDVNSQDYKTAQTELDKLKGKLKEEQEATRSASPQTGTLTPPGGPTGPSIKPPLELPEEAAPPATESAEPTPIPAPQE